MLISHRHRRNELDQLVEEYTSHRLSRQVFLRRAVATGLSVSAATALLAACGEASPPAVDVLNVWGGEEQDSFKAVVAPFTKTNNIAVNVELTRDLDAALTSRLRGNNPPDIAILPNPGKMQQLAKQNKLVRLDKFLPMTSCAVIMPVPGIDLGTYNGGFYALFYKAANKGTVWYNPNQFTTLGVQPPAAWSDLLALSDKIASSGNIPGNGSGEWCFQWVTSLLTGLRRFT